MKKSVAFIAIVFIIIQSCQKEVIQEDQVQGSVCKTTETMAAMDPEMKALLAFQTQRNQVQVPSLLIYLDFDGAIVTTGFGSHDRSPIISGTRICPPAPLTPAQIAEVVSYVADDFSPFNITVTTDFSEFQAQSAGLRHLCIVSTVPAVIGHQATTAGVSPFICSRIPNSPCFAFALAASTMSELSHIISHELAHTLGLDHQSLYGEGCSFFIGNTYHPGFGSGDLAFHPIMGKQENTGISNWYQQSCFGNTCRQEGQNDFQLISDLVQLRGDDFPDQLTMSNSTLNASFNGALGRQGDVDFVKINVGSPGSLTVHSEGNVDLKVTVLSAGGHIFGEYSDPESLDVTIPSVSGLRFLKIEAGGNPNISSHFLTGKYRVTF